MISDSLFLQALIEYGVDVNEDGQIQLNEAEAITTLEIGSEDILSLNGIEAFSNLTTIKIGRTLIDSVDLTNNLQLVSINLADNELIDLQISSLQQLKRLALSNNELSNLDLSNLPKLEELDLRNNNFSSLNLSNLLKLNDLNLRDNYLSSLSLSGLPDLLDINVTRNNLDSIDFSETPKLRSITISGNNITNIDVKHLRDLISLVLHNCPIKTLDIAGLSNLFTLWLTNSSVETIFMKGTSPDQSQLQFDGAPLKYICTDGSYISEINEELSNENITDCLVTSFCPYTDEGVFGGISGKVKIGQTIEDCDSSTNYLAFPKLHTKWSNPNGLHFGVLIGTQDGFYDINFYGSMTLTPALTYANEWQHIVPEFSAENYSSNPQNHIQDFCIIPVSDKLEAELNIIPLQEFRAGFESNLILMVRNTGTLPFSGTLTLNIPQDSLTYISSDYDPSLIESTSVSWEIQDLLPFNKINISTTFRLNSPMDTPPLTGGENIQLCVELNDGDQYQNNICVSDFSVNSFDPNDKTYLGKDTITIDKIEELDKLTYLIRFENTGSAEAINIVISDALDNTFIIPSSIRILDASHDVKLEMGRNNVANFIFPNIYLPFESGFNRGYVLFSVETRNGDISVNDQINNSAAIYFDFNFPIITNEASIWIIDEVSSTITTTNLSINSIKIFPNPSTGDFTIESETNQNIIEKIDWVDMNGKTQRIDNINSQNFKFSKTDLIPGVYSLRITTAKFVQIQKVIIQGN